MPPPQPEIELIAEKTTEQRRDDYPVQLQIALMRRKPGRPAAAVVRPMLSIRVDPDVAAALRASGKGWQTRVNALLRQAVEQGRLQAF